MSTKKRITMPRRTQEFDISAPQSSVKKPQIRVSRIAQPVRKSGKPSTLGQFGENGRSRSLERGLNGQSLGVPLTATKKSLNPRSSSATPQRRTPLRSVGYGGPNAESFNAIPSTVERERSSVEVRKIFDYLARADVPDLPKEFVERASIKAMSMKQFLIIVAYLLRQIGGSRYKIGANFIEDIMRAITELQCPFTVNKSMLKTPSAPHSMVQVVTMLTWLIQLAPSPNTHGDWVPCNVQAAEFPSQDFTQFFFQSAIESFHLWNLQKEDEFGAKVATLVDRYVANKTGGLTQDQVRQRTEQIMAKLATIDAERPVGNTRDRSFDVVQRDVLERQRVEKELFEETKRLAKQLERQEADLHQRRIQYYDCENAIRTLREDLARQKITAAERNALQAQIAHNKNLIAARRHAITSMEDKSSDYQITLSRLIKKKINAISELNTQLHNFANAIKPDIQFTPIELSPNESNYPQLEQKLVALERQLTGVFQQYRDLHAKLSQQKYHLEQQLSDLRIALEPLELKATEQTDRLQRLQQQREKIARELAVLAVRANENEKQGDRERELESSREQVQKQFDANRKAIDKLAIEKQQLMAEGLERCRQALKERHQKLETYRTYVEQCETVMRQIVNVCSKDARKDIDSIEEKCEKNVEV